ncbi:hypothetical protein ACWEWX_00175, partial [Streptomyces asiaticus]
MRRSADIDALQQVLSAALGSPDPVCALARLDQGTGAFAALDTAVLERPTLVAHFNGHFCSGSGSVENWTPA